MHNAFGRLQIQRRWQSRIHERSFGMFILQEEKNNPKSLLKAIKYFEEAMNFGYVKAGFHLAYCYENGIVMERNMEKAIRLVIIIEI